MIFENRKWWFLWAFYVITITAGVNIIVRNPFADLLIFIIALIAAIKFWKKKSVKKEEEPLLDDWKQFQ